MIATIERAEASLTQTRLHIVMEFWASSETFMPADRATEACRKVVEPFLQSSFSEVPLKSLSMKLRYIPIVMPVDMHNKYTERSKARLSKAIYDCAPQLDYELFVSGSFSKQLEEYLRGIALSGSQLQKFGATPDQVNAFETVMMRAHSQILNGLNKVTGHGLPVR